MYTSTSTKSLLLKATSFSTSPGNNISFSNFEYVISFVLSLLKKYCSPKNPRIINIHNHIILNFGGIGVTFLFGIFFITIYYIYFFYSYSLYLRTLIAFYLSVTPQVLYAIMASFSVLKICTTTSTKSNKIHSPLF